MTFHVELPAVVEAAQQGAPAGASGSGPASPGNGSPEAQAGGATQWAAGATLSPAVASGYCALDTLQGSRPVPGSLTAVVTLGQGRRRWAAGPGMVRTCIW